MITKDAHRRIETTKLNDIKDFICPMGTLVFAHMDRRLLGADTRIEVKIQTCKPMFMV